MKIFLGSVPVLTCLGARRGTLAMLGKIFLDSSKSTKVSDFSGLIIRNSIDLGHKLASCVFKLPSQARLAPVFGLLPDTNLEGRRNRGLKSKLYLIFN